jgi:hypothetical protein
VQKLQLDSVPLIAAVVASALALLLPPQYIWVTSISGFVLLSILFSHDRENYRTLFQSLAYSGACGLGVMLLLTIFYHWLADRGEIHMTGGRIEYEWLPLTWLAATAGIGGIDRIRMMGHKDAAAHAPGTVQRGFIPQYAEPVAESAPAPRPISAPVVAPPEPVTAKRTEVAHETTQAAAAAPVTPVVAAPVEATPAPPPFAVPAPTPVASAPSPMPLPSGKETEIYIALVGEGLNLMRTVRAEHLGRDFYKIVEAMPEGETWEYGPGQVVRCKKRNLSTGKGLVAVEEAPRAS